MYSPRDYHYLALLYSLLYDPYYELNIVYYGYGNFFYTITTRKMIIDYQVTYLYTLS
jgi:hypothetical protein